MCLWCSQSLSSLDGQDLDGQDSDPAAGDDDEDAVTRSRLYADDVISSPAQVLLIAFSTSFVTIEWQLTWI